MAATQIELTLPGYKGDEREWSKSADNANVRRLIQLGLKTNIYPSTIGILQDLCSLGRVTSAEGQIYMGIFREYESYVVDSTVNNLLYNPKSDHWKLSSTMDELLRQHLHLAITDSRFFITTCSQYIDFTIKNVDTNLQQPCLSEIERMLFDGEKRILQSASKVFRKVHCI